jgi:TonB family protein
VAQKRISRQDGDFTALRARRWEYAGFFLELKRRVAGNWRPEEAFRSRPPSQHLGEGETRVTVLQISLNPDGSIKGSSIKESSGMAFLDEEAIRAVQAAQPFSAPPKGLVDPRSGLVSFSFGFRFVAGQGDVADVAIER